MHSRLLCSKGLQERSVFAQSQNEAAQSSAEVQAATPLEPTGAAHSGAESLQTQSENKRPDIAHSLHALPAELAALVERWPALPEHIRAAIVALAGTVKP